VVGYVYAMGTTLNQCFRVLRKAGARGIAVLIAARVYRARSDMRIVFNEYALLRGATEGEHAAAVTAVAG
jgi:glutamine phosphoribosylpyrophosphate amidotransferase